MTEQGSVACPFLCPQNNYHFRKETTLENQSVQSSESCLIPEVQLHAFCGFFFVCFFFEHLGWPSVRAYNQLLTGCGQNFCNLWRGFSSQMRLGYCRGCQATFGCLFWDLPTCCIRGQNFMCSPLPRARRAETSIFILSLSDPFNIFRECTVETESPFPPGSVQIASFCSTRLHFAYCSQDRVSLPTSKACSSCFAHLEWLSRLSLYLVFFLNPSILIFGERGVHLLQQSSWPSLSCLCSNPSPS